MTITHQILRPNNILVKQLLFFTILFHNIIVYSQEKFEIHLDRTHVPKNFFLDSSYYDKDSSTYYEIFQDTIRRENFNRTTYYPNGEVYITHFRWRDNSSMCCSFDQSGKAIALGLKYGIIHIAQQYDVDGRITHYGYYIEDTLSNKSVKAENSYEIYYNENGTIKSQYYFSKGKQVYKEYRSNGNVKIIADFIAENRLFCGKYKEYDENQKIVRKGSYSVETLYYRNIKTGIWKYYKNGVLIKKEKYSKDGKLIKLIE